MGLSPQVNFLGDKFRAVVQPDAFRHPILGHRQVEGRDHVVAFIAESYPEKGTHTGHVIDHRTAVQRSAREADSPQDEEPLRTAAGILADILKHLPEAADLDTLRGMEGEAARHYFAVFVHMILADRHPFSFAGRNRRPPSGPGERPPLLPLRHALE